jgi:hypothetical protein
VIRFRAMRDGFPDLMDLRDGKVSFVEEITISTSFAILSRVRSPEFEI